jgi:hypothetical protein
LDDGLVFDADTASAETIRDEDEYSGVRVSLTLTSRHPVDGDELQRALAEVADYRAAELAPLVDVLDGYAALAQGRWAAWRRKQHLR